MRLPKPENIHSHSAVFESTVQNSFLLGVSSLLSPVSQGKVEQPLTVCSDLVVLKCH